MKQYWKYFKYIVEHKKNVAIECLKMGMPIHAITHDMSKFKPSEFIRYANFFYETDRYNTYKKSDENKIAFKLGWLHHQKRNKHHWNYWVSINSIGIADHIEALEMPWKHVKQMIADWRGMSRKFPGTAEEYWEKNKDTFILHPKTKEKVEYLFYGPAGAE